LKEAEPLLREVVQAEVKNRPDHPSTLIGMENYASLLRQLGRKEAADWAMRSMEAHVKVLKLKHPFTRDAIRGVISQKIDLARADRGLYPIKLQEALGIADRALEQARRELGPDDAITLELRDLRAGVLFHMGDFVRAGSSAEELLAVRRALERI